MSTLSKLIYHRRLASLLATLCCVLNVSVTLWWSGQLSGIIDRVSSGDAPDKSQIVLALLTMLTTGAVKLLAGYASAYACESISHDLRMGYARHFAALPVIEAEKLNIGKELSQLQNEISGITAYLNGNLFNFFDGCVHFLLCFSWLLLLHPPLALLTNLPAFLILLYIAWSSKIIGALTTESQEAKSGMNRYADTLLTLFPVMRLYNAQALTLTGYEEALGGWERKTVRLERIKARLMSLSGLLSKIPLLLLFLIGGAMTIDGAVSVGTLYIFLYLSGSVSGALMNMPGQITAFRQFSASMKRLEGRICL